MPVARSRRRTAAAITLAASLTAGATLLLSACGPDSRPDYGKATHTPPAPGGSTPPPTTAGADPAASKAPLLNGTAHNGLTISDGTRYVVMNGTRVDFGTAVRDLAWSPDGKKAAFVDGDGDLAVAAADGSGRRVVAKNPGSQNWSHPTWQVRTYDPSYGVPAADNLQFAVRTAAGVSRLYTVPATGENATPKVLGLNGEPGGDEKPLPQTGNLWPNGGGTQGGSVYANSADGHVYVRDDNLRQQGYQVAPGSEPAFDPSGDEGVVFVRSVAGHDHLFLDRSDGNGHLVEKDLTPGATTDYTEPAFSPGGTVIAARTPDGIVTLPADGSHAPVVVSDYRGLPAFRAS
ncbi:hypothetical protein OG552_17140 [Streptomyces sp. NBC_01476]|uniref:hypothetical protein n=1 Tax=Streptomyces sp. NBC_01476 TaxID=2903881 RepID=UPI002E33A8C1|nr:hypothetical protein [Streptomyces sp. NBC_01476]